jgi:ATP-dependent helicase/nuclease subunit A
VVFLVNLAKGTGGHDEPVTVLTDPRPFDELPEAAVAIDGLGEDLRAERDAREMEESKRLLYVALTRARDRICLVSPLDRQGRFRAAPTSLGAVLPPSVTQLFELAGSPAAPATLPWIGPRATHQVRVLSPGAAPQALTATAAAAPLPEDFAPVDLAWRAPRTVTSAAEASAPAVVPVLADDALAAPDPLAADLPAADLGTLVHRALAAGELRAAAGLERRARLERLAGPAAAHVEAVLEALASTSEVQGWLEAEWWHEVPFSWRAPGGDVVRGVMDAMVVAPAAVTVLEVKTGAPLPSHEAQLSVYVQAAAALFPGRSVTGQLIYGSAKAVRFVLVSA